jgi:hypothetical protein
MMAKKMLGEILRERQLVDEATLKAALEVQRSTGDRLGTTLVKLELIDSAMLASLLAEQHEVQGIDPAVLSPSPEAYELLTFDQAMALGALPLWIEDKTLGVAMADPRDETTLDKLRELTGYTIQRFVAPQMALYKAVKTAYKRPDINESPNERLHRIVGSMRKLVAELEDYLHEQSLSGTTFDKTSE